MLWTPSSGYSFAVDNWGTNPSSTPGTSVVPGASNAEGTYTQVLAALAQGVHGFLLRVSDGGVTANIKNHLLDVGVDPAGGTAYTAIISNLVCGSTSTIALGACALFFFPIEIPAGATVAVRIQGSNATAGTVRVGIRAFGQPNAPWLMPLGQFSQTIGAITNSNGVSFTPGNAADGTYVSLGTTTLPLWWWQIAYQIDNAVITAERTYIDLAVGDGSNKRVINRIMHAGAATEQINEVTGSRLAWHANYWPVPAGAELWVRGRCENAPDTGYNAVAVGVGG